MIYKHMLSLTLLVSIPLGAMEGNNPEKSIIDMVDAEGSEDQYEVSQFLSQSNGHSAPNPIKFKRYTFMADKERVKKELKAVDASYYCGYLVSTLQDYAQEKEIDSYLIFVKKKHELPLPEAERRKLSNAVACEGLDDYDAPFVFAGQESNIFDQRAFQAITNERVRAIKTQIPIVQRNAKDAHGNPQYRFNSFRIANVEDHKECIVFWRRFVRDYLYLTAKCMVGLNHPYSAVQLFRVQIADRMIENGTTKRDYEFLPRGPVRDLTQNEDFHDIVTHNYTLTYQTRSNGFVEHSAVLGKGHNPDIYEMFAQSVEHTPTQSNNVPSRDEKENKSVPSKQEETPGMQSENQQNNLDDDWTQL